MRTPVLILLMARKFLWFVKPKVRWITMNFDQMFFAITESLEFFGTTLYQTLIHALFCCQYLEERVMPFQDVNIKQVSGWKGAFAGAADITVEGIVMVLIVL